jgi:hypothetical protein
MTEEALDYHKKTYQYDWLDIEQARVQERERCAVLVKKLVSGKDYPSDPELGEQLAAAIRSLK